VFSDSVGLTRVRVCEWVVVWALSAVGSAHSLVSAGNDGALHQWHLTPPVEAAPDAVVRITRRADPLFVGALPFNCAVMMQEVCDRFRLRSRVRHHLLFSSGRKMVCGHRW
jgi:hypothetical protein